MNACNVLSCMYAYVVIAVVECVTMFNCLSVEDSLLKRKCKFMSKLSSSKNLLISFFADDAAGELSLFQGR